MALSINDIKSGLTILVDGLPYLVTDAQHVKPGKGAAFVRVKIKNLKNDLIQERTFRGDEKIDPAFIEERKLQYLYSSGNTYHFMDQENFEDIAISEEVVGQKKKFLKENSELNASFYEGEVLNIILPFFINFLVTHTEPGIKGDTAKSGTKPATIETGATIQVPLFVNPGDVIRVDTRTGEYIERA
ncbi:MAG: elongation factor P [Candidatus Omnitrophota bacterium]|nr:MAG: elongation factor P [Candidatus Omnitrophota bacterium]